MISYAFRKAFNVRQAAISSVASLALGASGLHLHQWLPCLAGVAGLAVAARWASWALSDSPAITIRESGVEVAGMFGVSDLAWSDITAITLQSRSPSNILGFYFGGTLGIGFQTENGLVSRVQQWLPTAAIELPPGGASELLETLNHALVQSRKGFVGPGLQSDAEPEAAGAN